MSFVVRTPLYFLAQLIIGASLFVSVGYMSVAEAATSYNLFTKVSGKGKVTRSPSSIKYASGATVTLTASPTAGNVFSGWSGGGCSGSTPTCTVMMTATTTVTATFTAEAAPKPDIPTLGEPANDAKNVSQKKLKFSWSVANAKLSKPSQHRIVISRDPNFGDFVDNSSGGSCPTNTCFTKATGTATSYSKDMDFAGTTYWWKVRANGSGGASEWSDKRSFTTAGSAIGAKLDSFIARWKGQPTDFDGAYGYQCVDLMRRYAEDVLGLNAELPKGNAYSIFDNANSSKFEKIFNKANNIPLKGDIIFWKEAASNGNAGHVAIFIKGDVKSFASFDQNYCKAGDGSGKGDCAPRTVTHKYTEGVVGWLHPK